MSYFTDREYGARPLTIDAIDEKLWQGLLALISMRINDGSFGYRFPEYCQDGPVPCGCSREAFNKLLEVEVLCGHDQQWDSENKVLDTPMVLDLLEFCAKAVGLPCKRDYHSYHKHYHLSWDRDAGLEQFVDEVNELFRRNGVAYELTSDGKAQRTLPELIANALRQTMFQTGDEETDRLLEEARKKFLLPQIEKRKDALRELWDAFERLKTLDPAAADKRAQADALLDRVATPGTKFRIALGEEARQLTMIGNSFHIRHSETTQEMLHSPDQVDYLFMRMFAFIHMILKSTAPKSVEAPAVSTDTAGNEKGDFPFWFSE